MLPVEDRPLRRLAPIALLSLVVAVVLGSLYACGELGRPSPSGDLPERPADAVDVQGAEQRSADRTPHGRAGAPADTATGEAGAERNPEAPARAVDGDGRPLPGDPPPFTSREASVPYCFLSVMTPDRSREIAAFRPDADGRFRLPDAVGAEPVLLFVTLDADRTILEHRGAVTAADIGGRDVAFVPLEGTSRVSLRCVDDEGTGVRCTFRVERAWGDDFRTEVEDETGGDGCADVTLDGGGAFRARLMSAATRATHFPRPWDRPFRATPGEPASVEWAVPRPAEIDVTVVDEDGRPVPGALVGVSTFSDGRFRASPAGRSADDQGRILLQGLDPVDAILRVAAFGREPVARRIRLASGRRQETIRLVPGGHVVTGQLVGHSDFGSNHLLRLGAHPDDTFAYFFTTLGEGRFRAAGVPTGEYQLSPQTRSGPSVLVRFAVPDGDVDLGTIDLAPTLDVGPLRLHVRVETGDPEDVDTVMLNYREASWPAQVWRSEGAWFGQTETLKDLHEGVYTVRMSTQGQDPDVWDLSATATATLRAGVETPTVVLRARRR